VSDLAARPAQSPQQSKALDPQITSVRVLDCEFQSTTECCSVRNMPAATRQTTRASFDARAMLNTYIITVTYLTLGPTLRGRHQTHGGTWLCIKVTNCWYQTHNSRGADCLKTQGKWSAWWCWLAGIVRHVLGCAKDLDPRVTLCSWW